MLNPGWLFPAPSAPRLSPFRGCSIPALPGNPAINAPSAGPLEPLKRGPGHFTYYNAKKFAIYQAISTLKHTYSTPRRLDRY